MPFGIRQYLDYSWVNFEFFCTTGATCCTSGVKFGVKVNW